VGSVVMLKRGNATRGFKGGGRVEAITGARGVRKTIRHWYGVNRRISPRGRSRVLELGGNDDLEGLYELETRETYTRGTLQRIDEKSRRLGDRGLEYENLSKGHERLDKKNNNKENKQCLPSDEMT